MHGDFGTILDGVLAAVRDRGRALVAIDGIGASGKTTLAAALGRAVRTRPVLVLHVDDFFNPPEVRHAQGRHSPEGFWRDAYDYAALTSETLRPLRADGDGWYLPGTYDREAGWSARPARRPAPVDALVLVEGIFLHRDELAGFWDHSLFLDVALDEAERRMAARDPVTTDSIHGVMQRYTGAQRIYFAAARPWERASVVVDNTEPGRPRVIAARDAAAAS